MQSQAPETRGASPPELSGERAAQTRRLAASVWAEMERCGAVPTPRAYDLWFTYRAGSNPELTQRLAGLLAQGEAPTPAVLDALHAEFLAGAEVDVDAVAAGSDEIERAAQTLVEQVAGSQGALREYGDTLARWAQRLGGEPAIGGLVHAVSTLTTETTKAAERNRVLEQQLSASAARITKLRQSLAEVKLEATTDALTGIANRKAFDARLKRAMAQLRAEPGGALSLLLVDVDHFKRFNDTHGHKVGDLVLRLVARLLADNVKGRDTAARYGGEEFAILLAGADLHAATTVAAQMCDALGAKRLVNKGSGQGFGQVTASFGVAQARAGESAAALVERADAALYEAKRTGRNRVCTEQRRLADVAA